jgi:hypothetical protein
MNDSKKTDQSKTTQESQKNIFVIFEYILIFAGIAILLFVSPHSIWGDGSLRYSAVSKLLTDGTILKTPYSMIGPIFSAPLWFLGKLIKSPAWWCSIYNLIVFTTGLFIIYRICRKNIDNGLLRKFLLILVFASMFPFHQTTYYGEVFTAILVGVGILAINQGYSSWGWCSIVLGVVNTPASVIGLGFVILAKMLKTRKWRYVIILIISIGLILAESWLRRGDPFNSGYDGNAGFNTMLPYSGRPGFSYPIFFGIISILFSFGKGIFWFCPGLLLPIRKNMPEINKGLYESYKLWIYFLIGLILVYSKWWSWYGGWFWGPRFFLFASIPASFALAAYLSAKHKSIALNLFLLLILALSFWIGINGVVFNQNSLGICVAYKYALESLCWYVPEFSVIFRPFVVAKQLSPGDIIIITFNSTVFIYLSIPLFSQLVKKMIIKGKEFKCLYLSCDKWKF